MGPHPRWGKGDRAHRMLHELNNLVTIFCDSQSMSAATGLTPLKRIGKLLDGNTLITLLC